MAKNQLGYLPGKGNPKKQIIIENAIFRKNN
jgi:hypothetical protein